MVYPPDSWPDLKLYQPISKQVERRRLLSRQVEHLNSATALRQGKGFLLVRFHVTILRA